MMRAEEKAGRLPATLTVPMILFILPTLFVILVGPAAIQVIQTFAGIEGPAGADPYIVCPAPDAGAMQGPSRNLVS